jgi:hypothetical protein
LLVVDERHRLCRVEEDMLVDDLVEFSRKLKER